jgi:hypothetical protein
LNVAPGARTSGAFTTGLTPWVIVSLAAILPYLPTINDYFVRDDFGVVQLLAGKPLTYFPRWFASSWMDDIWGYLPDEVRPFPALSYQLTALGGPVSPFLHHALNILIHAANGLLVMAIALRAARLNVPAATTAALIFVLMPVHAESVAWITGRVDSMPAFFYLASFLAFVRYRQESKRALSGWALYLWAIVLFFVALFTKQNTITMVATLAGYDVIVGRRRILPLIAFVRPYVPFVALTAAYLWLRYLLFGQVAREGALNARALQDFGVLLGWHTRHVIAGDKDAPAAVVWLALVAVVVVWLCARRRTRPGTAAASVDLGRRLLYFGPVWWAIGVLPIAVAGYHSPRHVYLAAVGWAIVLGVALEAAWSARPGVRWRRAVAASAALVVLGYSVPLYRAVKNWREMADVSHTVVRDVRDAALSAQPGSMVVVGAPGRSWEWALPFAVRPPYQRTDLRARVFIISPRALSCCTVPWYEETRRTIRAWSAGEGRDAAVALRWDPRTGAQSRATSVDSPQLPALIRALADLPADDLDRNLRRLLEVLPVEVE